MVVFVAFLPGEQGPVARGAGGAGGANFAGGIVGGPEAAEGVAERIRILLSSGQAAHLFLRR